MYPAFQSPFSAPPGFEEPSFSDPHKAAPA
jgi:cold shock CspA family protein